MSYSFDKHTLYQYKKKRSWWKVVLGYCPCCERYFKWPVTVEHRRTAYCNDADNYLTSCKECHREDDAYFEDLWDEYNAGRL